jgi:general secretion pathway protein I
VNSRGFTLLEMLVASLIMAVAVVGLLAGIDTSLRNAARLTEHDRAALLARAKMDELLVDRRLRRNLPVQGEFDPALTGGARGGWRARLMPFEQPPGSGPGTPVLDRLELEIWWETAAGTRSMRLAAYRPTALRPEDVVPGVPGARP